MIQNAKLNNWNPHKTQPPIWSLYLHHSHRFKQALATEIDSKTHHRFNNPRRRFSNTRWFNPPLKPNHWFNFNIGTETQPTPKRPPRHQTHGWSTIIQTHDWIFIYLTLQLLAYLYLTLSSTCVRLDHFLL